MTVLRSLREDLTINIPPLYLQSAIDLGLIVDMRDLLDSPEDLSALLRQAFSERLTTTIPAGTSNDMIDRHRLPFGERLSYLAPAEAAIVLNAYIDIPNRIGLRVSPDHAGSIDVFLTDEHSSALEARAFEKYIGLRALSNGSYSERDARRALVYVHDLPSVLMRYQRFMSERAVLMREAMREHFRAQMSQARNEAPGKAVRSGGGDFTAFAQKFQARLVAEASPLSQMEILPHGTLSSRRWGIEIEAVDIANIQTPKYWDLREDGSLRSLGEDVGDDEHSEDCGYYSDYDTDECDCGYYDRDEYSETGEYTSPILRSYHSRGLEYLCRELEHRQTNSSPGIHVHVEASDLTPAQAGQVLFLYALFEPLFESEYQRITREYCKKISPATGLELMRSLRTIQKEKGPKETTKLGYFTDRYRAVNLNALSAHGTIEFRAMGPRYNYELLTRWAQFCREIVNVAKANVPQSAWSGAKTFHDLLVVFSKYGKETPTPGPRKVKSQGAVTVALGNENRMVPNVNEETSDVFEDYRRNIIQTEDRYTWSMGRPTLEPHFFDFTPDLSNVGWMVRAVDTNQVVAVS